MIKDIEERLNGLHKRGYEGYDAKEHFQANAEGDIEYLLSLVRKQREALERIYEIESKCDKDSLLNSIIESNQIAEEALKEQP